MGSTTNKWKNLYLSGVLSDGTNEATLSELKNGIIKEINTQYIRIWDLDVGIYKLTYYGHKYIYYNGSTSTSSVYVGSGIPFLYVWSTQDKKVWLCDKSDNSSSLVVYSGNTSETSGVYKENYKLSPIPSANGSTQVSGIYAPTTAGTTGQVLVSNGSGEPTWSSDIPTKTYVDNAIQNAIGNVLNGEF